MIITLAKAIILKTKLQKIYKVYIKKEITIVQETEDISNQ
jgi:hypothetical protein